MKTSTSAQTVLGTVCTTGKRAAGIAAHAAQLGLVLARDRLRVWKKGRSEGLKRFDDRESSVRQDGRRGRWENFFLFARECIRAPRSVGAICPSGPALAAAMAARVGEGQGLVVELGAGTGVVTAALLQRGIAPQRLVVLERSEAMVKLLRQRFPHLTIIHGDAAKLSSYLPEGSSVDCIVSSLPFLSIPEDIRTCILQEIRTLLVDGGSLLQYTYMWAKESCLSRAGLTCVATSMVWKNMPPARVMEFR